MNKTVALLGALVLAGLLSSPALAQVGPPASRLDVGIGVLWIGAEPLGTRPATETTGAGGETYVTIFVRVASPRGFVAVKVVKYAPAESRTNEKLPAPLRASIASVRTVSVADDVEPSASARVYCRTTRARTEASATGLPVRSTTCTSMRVVLPVV